MFFKINPSQSHNSLLNAGRRNAAYKQTEGEHNEALNYYVRPTDTPPERLLHLQQGVEREKQLEKYWDNDELPRHELSPGSSFITGVRYVPGLRLARITMGDRTYSYPMNPNEVGDLVTAPSIGGWYNARIKRK